MKKIFTLLATVMTAVAVNAQVAFCDKSGNEYNDGETMTAHSEENEWGDVTLPCPVLKNNGGAASVKMEYVITALPANTGLSDCSYTICQTRVTTGNYESDTKILNAGEEWDTAIEWNCLDTDSYMPVEGTCTVVFTLFVNGNKDKTVTVNFVHGEGAGISSVAAEAKLKSIAYSLDGKLAGKEANGVSIVRMSNGSVRKVVK